MDKLDALIEQARAGRGLWVGLSLLTEEVKPFKFAIAGYPAIDDPHCTLQHLGKQSALLVAPALKASAKLADLHAPIEARIGGVARFSGSESDGDPLVFLLEAPIIRSLAVQLRDLMLLDGATVRNSGYFDYKPHVTVTRIPRDHGVHVDHPPKGSLAFRSIVVVCGDARQHFVLRG
jgi:2'-5' RNA ligase